MRDQEITTLRIIACPDTRTCPAVHEMAGQAETRYVVGKVVDEATAAKFAHLIGPGEALIAVPTELLPEV